VGVDDVHAIEPEAFIELGKYIFMSFEVYETDVIVKVNEPLRLESIVEAKDKDVNMVAVSKVMLRLSSVSIMLEFESYDVIVSDATDETSIWFIIVIDVPAEISENEVIVDVVLDTEHWEYVEEVMPWVTRHKSEIVVW